MRKLKFDEVANVSGAYSDNFLTNIVEGVVCSVGGAVIGSWTLATLGGRGASGADLVGIGGGFTALIGMLGGAVLGAAAGAVAGPFVGYDRGLVVAEDMIRNLMQGLPGGFQL
jgi:hypothetical protein